MLVTVGVLVESALGEGEAKHRAVRKELESELDGFVDNLAGEIWRMKCNRKKGSDQLEGEGKERKRHHEPFFFFFELASKSSPSVDFLETHLSSESLEKLSTLGSSNENVRRGDKSRGLERKATEEEERVSFEFDATRTKKKR